MNRSIETDVLRLVVGAGVNVLAARYLVGLLGLNREWGSAAAIGAMLYQSSTRQKTDGAEALLYQAASLLTAPGSAVVSVLASSTKAPAEVEEPT
jgi:hypothetical protein